MRYLLALSLASLSLVSCQKQSREVSVRFHEDGRLKPTIALVDVVDSTNFDFPWSLSEELTDAVAQSIKSTGVLFLPNSSSQRDRIPYGQNLFSSDLSWIKKDFSSNQFVVFIELLDHTISPIGKVHPQSIQRTYNLEMAARIRVVDLRSAEPRIILQEKLTDSCFLSKSEIPVNYQKITWGTKEYPSTPLGAAHKRLANLITERLRDYVLLAHGK